MPELGKHEAVGTNGTTNTHTTIDSITSANTEQSEESNLEPSLAAEQIEPVTVAVVEDGEKPQKPANGKCCNLISPTSSPLQILPLHHSTGAVDSLDESTLSEDSLEPNTPIIANEETNDSDSHSSAKR
jgi:hypothetical protein